MAAGRPRSFDKDIALEKAMKLYWKHGYANTSLVDLTEELGLTKPSLYAAFGDKEQLFISALELYAQQQLRSSLELLTEPTQPLQQRLRNYLKSVARVFTQPASPGGCLMVNSTCEFAAAGMPEQAKAFLSELSQAQKQRLVDFFAAEKANGTLQTKSSPMALALFLMSINSGLAVRARSGVPLEELDEMIEHAVETFA